MADSNSHLLITEVSTSRQTPANQASSFYSYRISLALGKPDVYKLSPGCSWKPGLQEPVLRYHPWRGQGAGVKQSITTLKSPVSHFLSCFNHNFNNKGFTRNLCSLLLSERVYIAFAVI